MPNSHVIIEDAAAPKLRAYKNVLMLVAVVLFIASFILTEVIALNAIHGRDTRIEDLLRGQVEQDATAACRSEIVTEQQTAISSVTGATAHLIATLAVDPRVPADVQAALAELRGADDSRLSADGRRSNMEEICAFKAAATVSATTVP